MTRELFWLTWTVILTGLMWVPYILNRCQVRGLGGAMANPARGDKPHAEWANRLMFAHDNAVENLVVFVPLVLILNAIDYSSKWTVLACAVYFWARVAHLIVYTWACRCSARWPSPWASSRKPCSRWRFSRCSDPCPGRGAASSCRSAEPGPYQTPAFVTAPALQRTASQGLRAVPRPGNADLRRVCCMKA